MPREGLRKAVSVGLGLLFAIGLAGEAYGFRQCPHHRIEGRAGSAAHAEGVGSGSEARVPVERRRGTPLQEPVDGPCICVGSCHAVPTAPGLAAPPALPSTLAVEFRFRPASPDSRIPRPPSYQLPFPNAPPSC